MFDSLPSISVVIPSFNQARFLPQALDSIVNQKYPKVEILVMDGGSTDGSIEIIKVFEDQLNYWQSQPDGGQSNAINEGIRRSSGELVAWLNSDDFYCENSLWKVGEAYQQNPGHGIYIGNGFRYNQSQGEYSPFSERHLSFNREALAFGLDYILQPSVFFSKQAWDTVEGLNADLHFCMDWDILIRISNKYSVALINEFLSASREYEETKTSSGKLRRVCEISSMVAGHTGQELTPGSAYYILETLLELTFNNNLDSLANPLAGSLYGGMRHINSFFLAKYGSIDGFPEKTDPQDQLYMPWAVPDLIESYRGRLETVVREKAPKVSIVVPSFNQAEFLKQTLDSIFNQDYPHLEVLVLDGGSSDGSVDIIKSYEDGLTYWHSKPDSGPADAINQGLSMAQGDLVAWLSSDDILSHGAVWEVAKAFLVDPSLDLTYGNALYINESSDLHLADHGGYRTGLYFGKFQPHKAIPFYWLYVHSVPQPTVFFRRSLLEKVGNLNEEYKFIFDFELFYRFAEIANIKKLERVQAFYRIHAGSKTSNWNAFLVELYRFSRTKWSSVRTIPFWITLKSYLSYYMKTHYPQYNRRNPKFWAIIFLISSSIVLKVGNPEYLQSRLTERKRAFYERKISGSSTSNHQRQIQESFGSGFVHQPANRLADVKYTISQEKCTFRSFFCSFFIPYHPGYSGGEIRDFHIIRKLLSVSKVDFYALQENPYQDRENILRPYLSNYFSLEMGDRASETQDLEQFVGRQEKERHKSYHRDVERTFSTLAVILAARIQKSLNESKPDFLFVSPQVNPLMLGLDTKDLNVRCVLASYDVEAVRVSQLHRRQGVFENPKRSIKRFIETRRAVQFERDNLSHFDGIIAVSDLDKSIFVRDYNFAPERILVVNNSVDTHYFNFVERQPTQSSNITFIGSLTYPPNHQAALRLIRKIMPLVWQKCPEAHLWIVGQSPTEELLSYGDEERVTVTGKVEDVRPYLAQSIAMCAPLTSGSGTKYKVLEALSAGTPVVCSSLALEGLNLKPDVHALVADSDEDLAKAILRLILDHDSVSSLTESGRALIEREYSWDANLEGIEQWLKLVTHLPKNSSPG